MAANTSCQRFGDRIWSCWQPIKAAKQLSVSWHCHDSNQLSLYQGNMEANASFEEEEVVHYAHIIYTYDWKIHLLFEMGSEVSPLDLHKSTPTHKRQLFICIQACLFCCLGNGKCVAWANPIVHHYKLRQKKRLEDAQTKRKLWKTGDLV